MVKFQCADQLEIGVGHHRTWVFQIGLGCEPVTKIDSMLQFCCPLKGNGLLRVRSLQGQETENQDR